MRNTTRNTHLLIYVLKLSYPSLLTNFQVQNRKNKKHVPDSVLRAVLKGHVTLERYFLLVFSLKRATQITKDMNSCTRVAEHTLKSTSITTIFDQLQDGGSFITNGAIQIH